MEGSVDIGKGECKDSPESHISQDNNTETDSEETMNLKCNSCGKIFLHKSK